MSARPVSCSMCPASILVRTPAEAQAAHADGWRARYTPGRTYATCPDCSANPRYRIQEAPR